jgi:hypothetical protein
VEVAAMSKARLIITAVVVEGRSKSEVARDYDVSRFWVQQLLAFGPRLGPWWVVASGVLRPSFDVTR